MDLMLHLLKTKDASRMEVVLEFLIHMAFHEDGQAAILKTNGIAVFLYSWDLIW